MSRLDDVLAVLAPRLPEGTLRDAEDRHREDPRRITRGTGRALALPRTVEEVAAIVRACHEARVPIVPYGGGTGLVGGQISEDAGALVVSLDRMSAVREVRPEEGVMIAEGGCVLADLQAAAEEADRLFPLSLASEGSARLGGLLGTNAGGVNVLRYGNMRDLTLGVEAVLPDGSVLRGLRRLRKDNTGYDLRHLLIGAEGTLGIVTAAALRLFPRPAERGAMMLAIPGPDAALDLLWLARERLGDGVSAFELISGVGPRHGRGPSAGGAPAARRPAPLVGPARRGPPRGPPRCRGAGGARRRGRRARPRGRWRHRPVRRPAPRLLGPARVHPRGQPPHRRGVISRRVGAPVGDPRPHRARHRGGRAPRPAARQCLRPCRRRQPPLQRLSAGGRRARGGRLSQGLRHARGPRHRARAGAARSAPSTASAATRRTS